MIRWAGRLIVFYGAAHLVGALTVERAASHVDSWLSGDLWHEDFADMGAAGSAYWLTFGSFSVPLILLGLMVLWLDRRGITPPSFVPWTLAALTVVDAAIQPFTPWPILLGANILLLVGARRAARPGGVRTQAGRTAIERHPLEPSRQQAC